MNPDSPLRVSEECEYQERGAKPSPAGDQYRKSLPILLWGESINNARVLFGLSLRLSDAVRFASKVPDPEPPGMNCDKLG